MTNSDRIAKTLAENQRQQGRAVALLETARTLRDVVTVGCFVQSAIDAGYTARQAQLVWQQVLREKPHA